MHTPKHTCMVACAHRHMHATFVHGHTRILAHAHTHTHTLTHTVFTPGIEPASPAELAPRGLSHVYIVTPRGLSFVEIV